MSYFEIATDIPDTKKLVLSDWFRVPAESIAAAKAELVAWQNADPRPSRPPLLGIIPLVVFGPALKVRHYNFEMRHTGIFPQFSHFNGASDGAWSEISTREPARSWMTLNYVYDNKDTVPLDPSYIGVDCTGTDPVLSINVVFPKANVAAFGGNIYNVTKTWSTTATGIAVFGGTGPNVNYVFDDPIFNLCVETVSNPPPGFSIEFTNTTTYDNHNSADVILGSNGEVIRTVQDIEGRPSFLPNEATATPQIITAGKWHNLIWSLDLSSEINVEGQHYTSHTIRPRHIGESGTATNILDSDKKVTSVARMFVVFDDVNLTRYKMSCFHPATSDDPNAIITVNGNFMWRQQATSSINGPDPDCFGNIVTLVNPSGKPTYVIQPDGVPFHNSAFAIPASSKYVDSIKRVERASLQMFTGIALGGDLDPVLENVRRAFVTDKGKPAPLSRARELLGKKPEVLLHGRTNWKKGRNTGTLAANPPLDGTVVKKINAFKPDPKLGV